ncbi:MAG TPA: hypothetical protein VK052_13775 [Zeimonas sp.]|nr:hypothetical protein [Zeimonas sp.]
MNASRSPLQFLILGWFSIVMGLSGLALAWHRATGRLGEPAAAVAVALAILAATSVVVIGLALGTVRGLRQSRLLVPEGPSPAPQAVTTGGESR